MPCPHRLDHEAAITEIGQLRQDASVVAKGCGVERDRDIALHAVDGDRLHPHRRREETHPILDHIADRPARGRFECRRKMGAGLLYPCGGMDGVVEDDERAEPPCLRGRRHDRRGEQVRRAVGAGRTGAAHRAGHDDRLVAADEQVEHECGFLYRVRTLNDDRSREIVGRKPLAEQQRHVAQMS